MSLWNAQYYYNVVLLLALNQLSDLWQYRIHVYLIHIIWADVK